MKSLKYTIYARFLRLSQTYKIQEKKIKNDKYKLLVFKKCSREPRGSNTDEL